MLKKVIIENFQSHEKSEFEFVPGVNVIIGESDTGKSAIFNAINWVATNRPLGESFRSEWGGDTQVVIHTTDKKKITRRRTHSNNDYVVGREVLTAFGADVPQEVTDTLRLLPQNIQSQMDAPFLLSLSPGEAAKMLNKAAAIDEIDSGIAALRKTLYQINSDTEYNRNELKKYNKEIAQYDNLPELEKLILQAEGTANKREDINHRRDALRRLQSKIEALKIKLNKLNYLSEQIDPLFAGVQQDFQAYEEKKQEIAKLGKLICRIREISAGIERSNNIGDALILLGRAQRLEEKLKNSRKKQKDLKSVLETIDYLTRSIAAAIKQIDVFQREYDSKIPETCPLCGGVMKKEA